MNHIDHLIAKILLLGLITHLVTTPEQRKCWAELNDWNHYASKFAD